MPRCSTMWLPNTLENRRAPAGLADPISASAKKLNAVILVLSCFWEEKKRKEKIGSLTKKQP